MSYTLCQVATKVNNHGGRLYLVGGAVRDQLLQVTIKDRDYCVTGISERGLVTLFPEALKTGESFPVYRLDIDGEECEIALARTERKMEGETGHNAFIVETRLDITIEEDLSRRDLSFNAMAVEIDPNGEEKVVIDPFGGVNDIQRGIVQAIFISGPPTNQRGARIEQGVYMKSTEKGTFKSNFTEDPLRLYRALRFAARYGYDIGEETKEMMRAMKEELSFLSAERVYDELCKVMNTSHPSTFFQGLKELDLLHVHFPSLAKLSLPQWDRTLLALDRSETKDVSEKMAILLLELRTEDIVILWKDLKMPTHVRDQSVFASLYYDQFMQYSYLSEEQKMQLIEATRKHPFTKQVESDLERDKNTSTNWVRRLGVCISQSLKRDVTHANLMYEQFKQDYSNLSSMTIDVPGSLQGAEIGNWIYQKKLEFLKNTPQK